MFVVDGLASILASKASGDAHAKPSTSNIDSIGNPPIYQVQRWVPSITYVWGEWSGSKAQADVNAKLFTTNIGSIGSTPI